MEGNKLAAWADAKRFADHVEKGDLVFFYHKNKGVIAAGEVKSQLKKRNEGYEWYRDVEFLTSRPTREDGIQAYLGPGEVQEITGKGFFWARTIKVPYLDLDESKALLNQLRKVLGDD